MLQEASILFYFTRADGFMTGFAAVQQIIAAACGKLGLYTCSTVVCSDCGKSDEANQ